MEKQKPTMSKEEWLARAKDHPFKTIFGAKQSNSKVGQTFVTSISKPKKPTKNS